MKKMTIVLIICIFLLYGCAQQIEKEEGREKRDYKKTIFSEVKEKEAISKVINEHFEALNWKDKKAYLKTLDEESTDFYNDRIKFFDSILKDSDISVEVSLIETEIEDNKAISNIRTILTPTSPLVGKIEQKNTISYNLRKTNGIWKISGFVEQKEEIGVPRAILNVTQLTCRIGEYGWAETLGTVKNIGDALAYNVKVYIDLKYGGEVVETGFTFVQGENIYPNQTKSFEKTFIDPAYWDSCSAWATE